MTRGGSIATAIALAAIAHAAPREASAEPSFGARLAAAAAAQVGVTRLYDPSYQRLRYPGGDVPLERGVCTDVVVRAFRRLGVDLQQLVHEDMQASFASYPAKWGMRGPDSYIDHRRVPNLQTFFRRRGSALPVTREPHDYQVGDLVTFRLPGDLPHIGIVSPRRSPDRARPLIVHNIGAGAQIEDVLFAFEITGHYRWK